MPRLHCSATSSSLRGSDKIGRGVSGPPTCGMGAAVGMGVGRLEAIPLLTAGIGV